MNPITKIYKERREEFEKTKFAKGGGSCFECCDYEGMRGQLLSSQKSDILAVLEAVEGWEKQQKWDIGIKEFRDNLSQLISEAKAEINEEKSNA